MNDACDPTSNDLLAALPGAELARWRPQLECVELRAGQVLHEAGGPLWHVHFPCIAIVSLLHLTSSGGSAETAVVGHEGVVGISLFMGGNTTLNRAVVQGAGCALRMSADAIKAEFHRSPPVMRLLLRYTQALITQMAQTVACNRHHSIDQQLCRLLLMRLDRLCGDELAMTQELIATLLGVRREGVTEAALKLQRAGLISYARGHIRVLQRAGLERRACECYAAVQAEHVRLLPRQAGSPRPQERVVSA